MRFLPTLGRTMLEEHFLHLLDGNLIRDPDILETTRLCLAPGVGRTVAPTLLLGGALMMQRFGFKAYVGVIYTWMLRVYAMIGSRPEIIGGGGTGQEHISVALWTFSPEDWARLMRRAKIHEADLSTWIEQDIEHLSILDDWRAASRFDSATHIPEKKDLMLKTPITMTERAAAHIRKLMTSETSGLRIGLRKGAAPEWNIPWTWWKPVSLMTSWWNRMEQGCCWHRLRRCF